MTSTSAAHFRSLTEDINTTTPGVKMIFHMLAALADSSAA
jgi:DNA invertase Pin-like site-specific DNA recombinase